jgi:hypothetical protein
MAEIKIDNIENLIILNKEALNFHLEPSNVPDNQGAYGKADCIVEVKNTYPNNYVCVRVRIYNNISRQKLQEEKFMQLTQHTL